MPSLKDLKTRIESVKSTRKITKAMQMVAAAKLRRAQDAAEAARPYAERFNAVMAGLAASGAVLAGIDATLPLDVDRLMRLTARHDAATDAAAIGRGELKLHGWVYKFETGEVFSFDPDQHQFVPLADVSPQTTAVNSSLPPI